VGASAAISHPRGEASRVSGYTPATARSGQKPRIPLYRAPLAQSKLKGEPPMKKKPFAFRISESTYQTLKRKAKRGKVTMTEFLERAITDKEIVVVDGMQELIGELKAIGRNLNQLTTLANMGKVDAVYLAETKAQLSGIYEKLSALCEVNR